MCFLKPVFFLLSRACVCVDTLQSCPALGNPMDCTCWAPLSMGSSRQEYWSGLLCPPPGGLPNPAMGPLRSPALAGRFFATSTTWQVFLLLPSSEHGKVTCTDPSLKTWSFSSKRKDLVKLALVATGRWASMGPGFAQVFGPGLSFLFLGAPKSLQMVIAAMKLIN